MTWKYVLYSYALLPLIVLGYLAFGSWALWRISRGSISAWTKLPLSLIFLVAFLVVPFGDEIVGRYRFAALCKSDAVVRISRVVTLDRKYMSPEGWPLTEHVPGRPGLRIAGRYVLQGSDEEVFAFPRIWRSVTEIRDEIGGGVLGEVVDYKYTGGWLAQWLPGHRSAETCPELSEKRVPLNRAVFRPADAS